MINIYIYIHTLQHLNIVVNDDVQNHGQLFRLMVNELQHLIIFMNVFEM